MLFTRYLLAGIVIGVVLLVFTRRFTQDDVVPEWSDWTVFAFGIAALAMLGLMFTPARRIFESVSMLSVLLPPAALIPAIDNLVKHDRRWQLWAGLVLSALPMLFWVAFVIGEFVTPH